MDPSAALVIVKIIHTAAWAFLAGSVLAVPICALTGRLRLAVTLTVIVLMEIGVLAVNHRRCPLTDVAARYTDNRQYNFDIYLPLWLARYNKQVFGPLFLAGQVVLMWVWRRPPNPVGALRYGPGPALATQGSSRTPRRCIPSASHAPLTSGLDVQEVPDWLMVALVEIGP